MLIKIINKKLFLPKALQMEIVLPFTKIFANI